MKDTQYLFAEFPSISEKEWKDKVIKDLKGKSIDALNWQMTKDITVAPFYTKTHSDTSLLQSQKENNDWEISEDFYIDSDLKEHNKILLDALMGGINAPRIILEKELSSEQLAVLFKEVEFDYISIHFRLSEAVDTKLFIQALSQYLSNRNKDIKQLQGSIMGCDFQEGFSLKTIGVDAGSFYDGLENIPKELAKSIKLGVDSIMSSVDNQSKTAGFSSVFFNIQIGKSYFPAIAKIRALQLLWARIMVGFEMPYIAPNIEVEFSASAYDDNNNTNMIRATTMAMSAIIGGANRLVVMPSDGLVKKPNYFSRRIARNVQHLLKMESFLDQVVDPSSGSYYIEHLTATFVEEAWRMFLEMEK